MVAIEPPEPTPEEQLQLKVEMDRLVKSLPERKRRTFLRFMKKGKEIEKTDDEGNCSKFPESIYSIDNDSISVFLNDFRWQRKR